MNPISLSSLEGATIKEVWDEEETLTFITTDGEFCRIQYTTEYDDSEVYRDVFDNIISTRYFNDNLKLKLGLITQRAVMIAKAEAEEASEKGRKKYIIKNHIRCKAEFDKLAPSQKEIDEATA
tara:strand:- start:7917 stop:8285 length:369 start_codon:yes stop_codon:yes gene_type:complete